MPWTATVKNVQKTAGDMQYAVSVEFADGITTRTIPFTVAGLSELTHICKNYVVQLERVKSGEIVNGSVVVDTSIAPPPPPSPPSPTADEVAQQEWMTNYQKVQRLQRADAAGLLSAAQKITLAALISKLKADWKIEYAQFI